MTPVVSKKEVKPVTKTSKPAATEEPNNGSTKGIKWGLNLTQTMRRLFEENHKNHWDDEKIIEFMLTEFPNRENKGILYNVREMRWRYNFGKCHEDKDGNPHAPEKKALQYTKNGEVYEKPAPKSGLSAEEKAAREAERKEKAYENREKLKAAIEKAEERVTTLQQKLTDHIEKYGEVKPPKTTEAKKPAATGKKLVIKKK